MLGTMLGGLFIAVLNNAMVLFDVNTYAQYVANGLVVLLAVLISRRAAPNPDFYRSGDSDRKRPALQPKRALGARQP